MQASIAHALGESRIIGGNDIVGDPVVKSAVRVLQILELFDLIKREAVVAEVAALLNFPQSSASVLLRSLVSIGYLKYNRSNRAFSPTTKVALLGSWIGTPIVHDGPLFRMMQSLNDDTKQCVVLAIRNKLHAQYIHVLQAQAPASKRTYVIKGVLRSLVNSSVGFCLLADLDDRELRRIIVRHNAEAIDPDSRVSVAEVMRQVELVRSEGYAMTFGQVTDGYSMISMPLPWPSIGERLVLGIGGATRIMEESKDFIRGKMTEQIAAYAASAHGSPVAAMPETLRQ